MKRLTRSVYDRKIAGVFGGLGEYFNIDPTILRLLAVVLIFASVGSLILGYIAAVIIIPNETDVM